MFVASRGLETIRSHVQRFGTALRAPTMQPRLQRRAPRRAGGTLASAKLPNWRKTLIARYPPQMPSMEQPSRNGDPERSVRYRSLLRDRAPRLHHFDGERGHQLRLMLVDRENATGLGMTLFETEEDRASGGTRKQRDCCGVNGPRHDHPAVAAGPLRTVLNVKLEALERHFDR